MTNGRALLIGHTWQHTFIQPRFTEMNALMLKETAEANQKFQKTDAQNSQATRTIFMKNTLTVPTRTLRALQTTSEIQVQ